MSGYGNVMPLNITSISIRLQNRACVTGVVRMVRYDRRKNNLSHAMD